MELKNKALKVVDILYYVLFACIVAFFFTKTTLLYNEYIKQYEGQIFPILKIIACMLFGISIVTIVLECRGIKERIILIVLLIVSLLYLYNRELDDNFKTIFITMQLIIGAKGKSGRIVLLTSYVIGWAQIILCFIFSLIGILPFYVYAGTRHGFGSIYPTDLACHFLILAFIICLLRNGKLKIYEYVIYIGLIIVNAIFMQAKVGLICLSLLIGSTFIHQFFICKFNIPKIIIKAFKILCITCYPLFAAITIYCTYTFVDKQDALINKFNTLRLRLLYGRMTFDMYNVSTWGEYIREVGNGGVPQTHTDYFFVDISYIRVLFFNGIVFFFTLLFIYSLTQLVLTKKNLLYYAFLFLLFALDCAIEHHIIEIAYGMTLALFVFTDYKDKICQNSN